MKKKKFLYMIKHNNVYKTVRLIDLTGMKRRFITS